MLLKLPNTSRDPILLPQLILDKTGVLSKIHRDLLKLFARSHLSSDQSGDRKRSARA